MRSLLVVSLCLLICAGVEAQTKPLGSVIGNQTVIPIATAPAGYAVSAQALIYYPDDYFLPKNANKRYPLFLFLHGAGEGVSLDITEVTNQSLPYLIKTGLKPYGIDTLTGDTVKFIVVSPHCAQCGGSYSYPQLQYTMPYLIQNYRIDTTCMWAGGLSSGGRATFSMPMGNNPGDTYWGRKLAGILPMANGGYDNNISTLGGNLADAMKSGMSVLYTIGDQDPGYNAIGYFAYNSLMSANAQPGKYYTKVIIGGTHSANVWNPPFYLNSRIFNPKWNAWDQMASTHRGVSTTPLSVSAGTTQTITLPVSSVTLGGTAAPSTGATITGYNWSFVSGPAAPVIVSVAGITTLVTGLLSAGTYVFQLSVTDSKGNKATSNVQVVVNPLINQAPTVSVGGNQTITLPTSTVTLTGTGKDADGTIASYAWAKVSGPSSGTITSASSATTTVTGLTQGTYVFSLTVTDNLGAKAAANVQVTVNAAPVNQPPTVNAGANQTITLPASSVTLSGSATDTDGTIASYAWAKVSGPSSGTITSASSATTTVTGLTQGTYVFSLTATDNLGAKTAANVQITVNPAAINQPPTVDAGPDQSITLPNVVAAMLNGTATGTIKSYKWVQVSGPTTVYFVNSSLPATEAKNLNVAGIYVLKLTVTDNSGATASDNMQVTVNAASSTPTTPPGGGSSGGGSGTTPGSGSGSGGTTVGNQTIISVPVFPAGYAQAQALIYYPDDYFTNLTKKYALYIFLHDEAVGTSTNIADVTKASLPQLIAQGFKPYGIDSVTKDTVKFIVVSPFAPGTAGSYSYAQLQYTIPYLLSNYRVDPTCVWLGGGSMGGRGTFSVPMESVSLGGKLAGIMPMSAGGYDTRTDLIPNLQTCLKNGLGYIFTVGASDVGVLGNAQYYSNAMKTAVQSGRGFYKEIPGLAHTVDAWTQPFLLTSRWWNGNKNAWDIMASTHSSTTTSAVAARAVTATSTSQLDTENTADATVTSISLWPNPVRDAFTLSLNNSHTGKLLIQVLDATGAIRKSYATEKSQAITLTTVDVSGLTAGTYFVRIQVGSWIVTRKIVKI
ncbi:MAG: T9SS type A sorting domain-containing protein [Chitinophagaceae bacterium]|nr:T9SS type A sorting domain-containing protein [Chitinophagaceae bacterium]